jgi:hypothetical protein
VHTLKTPTALEEEKIHSKGWSVVPATLLPTWPPGYLHTSVSSHMKHILSSRETGLESLCPGSVDGTWLPLSPLLTLSSASQVKRCYLHPQHTTHPQFHDGMSGVVTCLEQSTNLQDLKFHCLLGKSWFLSEGLWFSKIPKQASVSPGNLLEMQIIRWRM